MLESPLLHTAEFAEEESRLTSGEHQTIKRKLMRSMWIALFFMVVEIVGGLWAGSLAIVTDAAHVLSDVSGIAVSLFALSFMSKTPTIHYTYGYHQAEILGALVSVMIVWAMTGVLVFEAYQRYLNLQQVDGAVMLGMALVGIAVNLVMILGLGGFEGHSHGGILGTSHSHGHACDHNHGSGHSHGAGHSHSHDHDHDHAHSHSHSHSHSHAPAEEGETGALAEGGRAPAQQSMVIRAALIHLVGDVLQSVGVLVAAVLIYWEPLNVGVTAQGVSRWNYADPLCTVVFSVLVMYTTYGTVRECVAVLMQRVPENFDAGGFESRLKEIPGVSCVHDIHIWSVGRADNTLCTAHVVVRQTASGSAGAILEKCIKVAKKLQIHHSTFQLEVENEFDHKLESFGNIHGNNVDCCVDDYAKSTV